MPLGRVLVLVVGFLTLFAATMAPTLLWGDDAELQRIAITGEARAIGQSSVASHLLWQAIAGAFVRATAWLPVDAAGRVTLVSAIAGVIALLPLAAVIRSLGQRAGLGPRALAFASAVGVTAFGVSHTFWLLASRPDAYTIQTALLATATWCAVRASVSLAPWRWWVGVVTVLAVTMTNHAMVLASVPGLAVLAISGRVPTRLVIAGGGVATVGAALGLAVAWLADFPIDALFATLWRYRPQLPRPLDTVAWLAFLVYQFPFMLPLVWWGMRSTLRASVRLAIGFALLFAGPVFLVLFPALYIRDQYIFYLPSYLPVAILIGLGTGRIVDRPPRWLRLKGWALTAMLLAMACAPVVVYPIAASIAGPVATRLAPARALPGRDPIWFYLWPPKTGYTGARDYATAAFGALPPEAVVVADWLPYQTMRYVQAVEGSRPDVHLEMINAGEGRQIAFLKAQPPGTPLFLADASPPPYYEIAEIRVCFDVQAVGVVYRLDRKAGC